MITDTHSQSENLPSLRWCDLNVKFLLEMNASLRGLDGIQGIIFLWMIAVRNPHGLWPVYIHQRVLKQNFPRIPLSYYLFRICSKMIYHTVCVGGNRLLI